MREGLPAPAPAGLAVGYEARCACLQRRDPAIEAVQSPCILVQAPINRFPIAGDLDCNDPELSTKRLANLVDVATEIGCRFVELAALATDQLGVHGPSLAALPRLVNAGWCLQLWTLSREPSNG